MQGKGEAGKIKGGAKKTPRGSGEDGGIWINGRRVGAADMRGKGEAGKIKGGAKKTPRGRAGS